MKSATRFMGPIAIRLSLCSHGYRKLRTWFRQHRKAPTRGGLMKSLICAASVESLLFVAAVAGRPAGAADDPKANSIDKIMDKLHKGKTSPLAVLKTALKSQSP